jgi:hypothetical protein
MAGLMLRAFILLSLAALPTAVSAEPLTVNVGESWAFSLKNGQPAKAHRVKPDSKPGRGEIKATVTGFGGTTMMLTNNSPTSYTFRAQLIGAPSDKVGRTCALPAGMKPALEYWPQKAKAVRISDFLPTKGAGSCPSGG